MKLFSLDLETEGLAAKLDSTKRIWCVSLAWRNESGELVSECLEWQHKGKQRVEELLADADVYFVCHNASFDIAVLRTHGINVPSGRYYCSMVAAYLTRPGLGHGLGDWGEVLGHGKGEHSDWSKYSEEMAVYAQRDAEITLLLWEHLWQEHYSKDKKLRNVYLDLELPYVEVIIELENTGLYIDRPVLEGLRDELQTRLDDIHNRMQQLAPCVPDLQWNTKTKSYDIRVVEYAKGYNKNKANAERHYTSDGKMWSSEPSLVYSHCQLLPFNPNSSDHLTYILMCQGWKPTEFSKKTGKPTCDGDTIKQLDYPLAKVFTEYAEVSKIQGTFVNGLLTRCNTRSLVRGSFNQCVTVTTRLSSSDPNLQNLPSRTELGKRVRKCVVAPPGYTLLVGDLDRIELVVLAYYLEKFCNESRMADAVRAGVDIHQANADAWSVTRKVAKGGIFAVNYGAQAKKLSENLGCTEEDAQKLIDSINTGMPAIQELKDMVWRSCKNRGGYVYDILGHRLCYTDINSSNKFERLGAERQSFNSIIQGGAGAIFKRLTLAALPSWRKCKARIAAVVHDEMLVYVPNEFADALRVELNTIFKNNELLSGTKKDGTHFYVPVTAEFNAGVNWVEAKGE